MAPLRVALSLALLLAPIFAQTPPVSVYFSTRFTESTASGRGGNILSANATCNPQNLAPPAVIESSVANSPGVSYVEPGVLNSWVIGSNPRVFRTDYVEVFNFPQMNLLLGDLDGDGIPHESSNFPGVDAMWIPQAQGARRNGIHDIFMSTFEAGGTRSQGNQGSIGSDLTAGDMVMFPAAQNRYPLASQVQAPIYFARRADWAALLDLQTQSVIDGLDVDGFTVDQRSGDIYVTFDDPVAGALAITTNGGTASRVTIQPGDIVRFPGAGFAGAPNPTPSYTPSGPFGIVTNPVSGFAEIVLPSAETNAIAAMAGTVLGGTRDVEALSIDPDGPFVNVTGGGFVVASLLYTLDVRGGGSSGCTSPVVTGANPAAPAIYSLAANGYASINGTTTDRANALGMSNNSFNPCFFTGYLDALATVRHPRAIDPINERPTHLDSFPTSRFVSSQLGSGTYNGFVTGYISGVRPGGIVGVFATLTTIPAGGFAPRWSLAGLGLEGYPELYVDALGFGVGASPCFIGPPAFCPGPFNILFASSFRGQSGNPIPLYGDGTSFNDQTGDACFTIDVRALIDPANPLPISPPPVLIVQAIDFGNLWVSSPLSFQFD